MNTAYAIIAIALSAPGLAEAHAHLDSSTPTDHSTLSAAPENLELRFKEPVQLTALSLQAGGSNPVRLGPLPSAAAQRFTVPLPALAPGSYVVTWRALSDDGHVMTNTIRFTIEPPSPPAAR